MTSGIYKIVGPDGSFYIGSSIRCEKRCKFHMQNLQQNKHLNPKMQNKYNSSPQGWSYTILEPVQPNLLLVVEQKYLNIHFTDRSCLNCNPIATTPPSWKGKKRPVEFGIAQSIRQKGQPGTNKGKKYTEDHKNKISQSLTGRTLSPSHIEAMIKGKTGKKTGPYKPRTPEHTEAIRLSRLKTIQEGWGNPCKGIKRGPQKYTRTPEHTAKLVKARKETMSKRLNNCNAT